MDLAAIVIPRFVTLKNKNNNNYLRYVHEVGTVHGFLQFTGQEAVSPFAKYEVQLAKSGNGLVHIRCCYNNKYWVRQRADGNWIVADAHEPEEDQSKWSCTLFKPVAVAGDASAVRFVHVQLGLYAYLWYAQEPYTKCLYLASKNPSKDLLDACVITDWESLLVLPKHVAFKGDNGDYLGAVWAEGHPFLQFSVGDMGSPAAANEIFTMKDGTIRIKNNHFGKFWRKANNWIWADSTDSTPNNRDTLFSPIKVGDNLVALRSLGNNNFCERHDWDGFKGCLNAALPTITKQAKIQVEELVLSRSIYNVGFKLMDARIYNQVPITLTTGEATNKSGATNTITLKLRYTDTKATTWKSSVSLKLGIKTSIKAGFPFIADGKIEVSAETTGSHEWGGTNTSSNEVETTYSVPVPPMTMIKVSLLATTGTCDVPFTYYQRDVLTNGQQITTILDDGVFTGINNFNFHYATEEIKL